MAVHLVGLAAIVVFYVLILLVGLWAARKQKSTGENPDSEDVMLAGRNIGLIVGVFTMTGGKTGFTMHPFTLSSFFPVGGIHIHAVVCCLLCWFYVLSFFVFLTIKSPETVATFHKK